MCVFVLQAREADCCMARDSPIVICILITRAEGLKKSVKDSSFLSFPRCFGSLGAGESWYVFNGPRVWSQGGCRLSCLVIKVGCITFIVRVAHVLLSGSWCGFFGFRWCLAVFSFGSGWSLHVQSFAVSLDWWSSSVHLFIPCWKDQLGSACFRWSLKLVKKLRRDIKTPVLVISTGNFIGNYPLYKSAFINQYFLLTYPMFPSNYLCGIGQTSFVFSFLSLKKNYLFIFVSFVEISRNTGMDFGIS